MQDRSGAHRCGLLQGSAAETVAGHFLVRRGLTLVERNFRCRRGEVDLIAWEGNVLVFVEVRLRTPGGRTSAAESIDARKQARILAAARFYLSRWRSREMPPCRFDAILMESLDGELQWLKDILS
jgi:putative endonuclease